MSIITDPTSIAKMIDNRTQTEADSDYDFWVDVTKMIIFLLRRFWEVKDLTLHEKKNVRIYRPPEEYYWDCQLTLLDWTLRNIEIKGNRKKHPKAYRKQWQWEYWTPNDVWLLTYHPWEFCLTKHDQKPDSMWRWTVSNKPQREYNTVFWLPLDKLFICFT